MSRKLPPPNSTNKISKALLDARRKQSERDKNDRGKNDRDLSDDDQADKGSKPGVGGAASVHNPRADAAERMGNITGVSGTTGTTGSVGGSDSSSSGSGDSASAATGDLSSFVGAQRTGAAADIAEAQAGVADRFAAPSLTDGRRQVAPEQAIAEAKAANPANSLRNEAKTMLADSAASQTTPEGVAAQGTGAVSDVWSEKGRVEIMQNLAKGGLATSAQGTEANSDSIKGTKPVDPNTVHPTLQGVAKVYQRNLDEGNRQTADPPATAPPAGTDPATAPAPAPAPSGGVTLTYSPGGTPIATSPDGHKTAVMENKTVTWSPNGDTTVKEKDGSTTTTHQDGSVSETPPTRPGVGTPDPEGGDDRFRHVSQELKSSMAPRGVVGNGDIDFGDDNFGAGATGPIADIKGTLLGDPGRSGAVVDGPATSGVTEVSPISNPDAVRPMEDSEMGGGLEDDPLEGLNSPTPNLQGRPISNNDDDDDDDDSSSSSDDDDVT
jgi:hypothetical protein